MQNNDSNYLEDHINDQPSDQFRIVSLMEFVIQQLPPQGKVLDYGCGAGHFIQKLSQKPQVKLVDGTELSPVLLAQSKKRNPKSVIYNSFKHKLLKNTYDTIYSLDVLEHIEDDTAVLQQLFYALKPKGQILISVPAHMNLYTAFDKKIGHWRRYEHNELEQKMKGAGFIIIKTRFWNKLGQIFVQKSIKNKTSRPQSIDQNRNFKQEIQNRILKLWFWLIENRVTPKDGLTIICIAYKP